MWDGKKSKIAKNTLIQDIDKGGLKLCDYEIKVSALKLTWVKRLTDSQIANWKILPTEFFGQNPSIHFNKKQPKKGKTSKMPTFYTDIHNIWMNNIKSNKTSQSIHEIWEESLWF